MHGLAVEIAERGVFGGALGVADQGHEAGGDVGSGAHTRTDTLLTQFAAGRNNGNRAGGQVGFFGYTRNVGGNAPESSGIRRRFYGLAVGLSLGLAGLQELLCVGSTDGRAQGSPHASRCFFGHGLAFYRE